jgi:hypothetical protein
MSKDAMLPCFICGTTLRNVMDDTDNQPSGGTEFRTYGHYGSTFWDSFEGEEIVINFCDECLNKGTARIARQRRWRKIVVSSLISGTIPAVTPVGRQWITHEMVPWFRGPEDTDQVVIEVEEIGVLKGDRIEWVDGWRDIKRSLIEARAIEEGISPPCTHERFFAECLDCGAKPLEGLR